MLKIRYDVVSKTLSGWTDVETEDLIARDGEAVVELDIPKPDVDDYEYYAYNGTGLVSSGKHPPPEPLVFTASPPGTAIGQRLTHIEDFLKEAYPE